MQAPALPSAVAAACASRLVAARSPACLGACRCRSHHAWGLPMRRQHLSARAQCLQGAGQPLVGRPDRRAHARCRASVPRLPRSDGDDGAARAARSPSTRSRIINPSSLISLLLKLISIVCLPLIGGEPCCCCRCTHRNPSKITQSPHHQPKSPLSKALSARTSTMRASVASRSMRSHQCTSSGGAKKAVASPVVRHSAGTTRAKVRDGV